MLDIPGIQLQAPIVPPVAQDDAPPPPPPIQPFVPLPKPKPAPPPKPDPKKWDARIVNKAQSIYPKETAEKQARIDNSKPLTPTGAWGAPQ